MFRDRLLNFIKNIAATSLVVMQACAMPIDREPVVSNHSTEGRQVLGTLCDSYANISTYRDDGTMIVTDSSGTVMQQGEVHAAFRRPVQLILTWDLKNSPSGSETSGIVKSNEGTFVTVLNQKHETHHRDLDAALAAMAGVSFHLSQVVPRLLLHNATFFCGGNANAQIVGTEHGNSDANIKRIVVETESRHHFELLVDDKHWRLRGWREELDVPSVGRVTTDVVYSAVDDAIDESMFK